MEDNADAVMQFLREFTSEKISPTSDDDVQIRCGIVGNYSLKPEEIDGEAIDWVLNYLEQRKCPYFLAVHLAKKVAQQISAIVCNVPPSNGENIGDENTVLQNATSLHAEAICLLRELSSEMLRDPDQTGKFGAQPLRFIGSVFAIKNGRRKMEDRHVILHDLNAVCDLQNAPNHSYYAVFDGHAGVETASFASAHLHINMVRHPSFLKDTKTAIIEAFKLTDEQFAERATRENLKSGATAVCALIRDSTLYIAWVGDSQALLVKQGKPHAVMNPHKPEREDERKRIEELGGYIYHHGTWRVNGTLAVSRALGDAEHKPFVSNEPEINVIALDGTEDFLVIACDGLWDKMSPSDVSVSMYRYLVDNPQDVDGIAAKLVHQSKLMGSNDNITTIVVFLRDIQSLIADSPKYAAIFPQLEGISVSSISQIANGTTGRNYSGKEELENKYQRPTYFHKDLDFSNLDPSEWSPGMQGTGEVHDRNGKMGVAEGMPPEQTSLSELPTPPIDEVVASKQFSEFSSSEQLKIFQEHLEAQGFHDVSLDEIQTSMSENMQFLSSEIQDDMGYLADVHSEATLEKGDSELPLEGLSDVQQHFQSDVDDSDMNRNQEAQHVTHQEVLNTASDIVLNTIETAVKHVSLSDSSSEMISGFHETFVSDNPCEKQDTADTVDFSLPVDSKSNPLPTKSSHQLNPNAEPFVMKRDFATFNPDTFSTSPLHITGTENISLLDTSTSEVSTLSEILVTDTVSFGAVQSDAPGGGAAAVSSPNISSPLPSAPPLEVLSEGQKAGVSEEYGIDSDAISSLHSNPLSSNLLENDGMYNKIESALVEVSAAVQDLEKQLSVQELENQYFGGLDLESKSSTQELDPVSPVLSLGDEFLVQKSMSVDHPPPTQELVDVLPSSLEPVDQFLPSLELVDQPLPVQDFVNQLPPSVQEFVGEPTPSALEFVDQHTPSVQEFVDQPPSSVQEFADQPPSSVQEFVDQPPPPSVQEFVDQPPPSTQEFVDQHPLVHLDQKEREVQKLASDNSLDVRQLMDEPVPSHDVCSLDKGLLDYSDLDNINKGSSQVSEIQDSLSELSITSSKDGSESKMNVLGTESVETEYSSALSQTILTEESSSILQCSLDQNKDSDQNALLQKESSADLKANDGLVSGATSADGVSKEVTKQVIGKDSLLPKEVQAKLLEVTSTTLPSESVTEDAPVGAVAVDLKTVPDGVPEAEGVTEDMDSDSEKDGGWSYVKASNGSEKQKTVKKAVDTNKMANKKSTVSSAKDRKVVSKTTGDIRNRQKGNVPGTTDTTKKVVPEKTEKKVGESKDKKDRPVAVSKIVSPQPVASKTMTADRKLVKKPTATVPRSIPSKPSPPASMATKQSTTTIANKTASSSAAKPQPGPEKVIGKPAHSSTPFRPNIQKSAPSAGTAKPLTRPASATASHSAVSSSASASKQNSSSQKPQPRASSAPLTSKTLPSTKVNTTDLKSGTSASLGTEVRPKPSGTAFRKPLLPPAKKQDVKETKDSTNKQILAKKTTQVSSATTATTQVRRIGSSTSAVKVDVVSKKSSSTVTSAVKVDPASKKSSSTVTSAVKVDSASKKSSSTVTSDAKTLKKSAGRTDVAKSSTLGKMSTTRGRIPLQSKQLSKTVKSESDKKAEANQSKNGPKKIVSDTPSSDQKCSSDNRMQEVNDEKGMLEVNAQETADNKSAGAGLDSSVDVPASEMVSKSELKQESNVIECPVSVPPSEEEKV